MRYVGFAVADSMFPEDCLLDRHPLSAEEVRDFLKENHVNACNLSHKATLTALKSRYNIDLTEGLASTPPKVTLVAGDDFIVLAVTGLPRLTDRHEYTETEIQKATFRFGRWKVLE